MLMLGKLQETRSLSSSIARATDLTKMTTCVPRVEVWSDMPPRKAHHTYLVEFQGVQQLVQFPVLTDLLKLHVMLLETVQRQFCLIIHKDFERLKRNKIYQ